jgi:predicted RNase H-like HicB family nuclease
MSGGKFWAKKTGGKRRSWFMHRNDAKSSVYTAIIRREDEWYVAECADTGTVSQGRTIEEALNNLKEATTLYLEEFPAERRNAPMLTTFEISTPTPRPAYA